MEEKTKSTGELVVKLKDEQEFCALIEQHYHERGFVLCKNTSSVRYPEDISDVSDETVETEVMYGKQEVCGDLEKIFNF